MDAGVKALRLQSQETGPSTQSMMGIGLTALWAVKEAC
jgi:hypothetical protein